MPRLDTLTDLSRNSILALPVDINTPLELTPLPRRLADSRVALVTSAGVHERGDTPFRKFDPSYRVIPSTANPNELVASHTSIGFDRVPMQQDMNIVFPLDRLRELVERGTIGSLAPHSFSFMGAQRDLGTVKQETAPDVAERLKRDGAELVFITPT